MDLLEFYKNNLIEIDSDFDEIFYQNEYPDLSGYWSPWAKDNGFSEKQRLFHHYYLHGKKEGRLCNMQAKIAQNEKCPDYFKEESLVVKNYGIHVFPYESTNDVDVLRRQSFSIESYIQNKIPQINIFSFGKKDPKKENIKYFEIKDNNHESYKCKRDYYFLRDILEKGLALTGKDDYLIYTNSDCHIGNKFYEFILSSNYDYLEFFRLETVEGVVVGQNKDGIDCFAIKNHVLKQLISDQILPSNLILGAPYWDAVVSSIARKHIQNKYQDTKRLFHTKHKPRWNFKDLDYAGIHNLSILNNLYNKGLINCRKSEIKSSTLVIRLFNKATDMLQARKNIIDERFGIDKITEFDYNYLFIEEKEKNYPMRNADGFWTAYSERSPSLTDEAIGTTAGTRYFIKKDQIEDVLKNEIAMYKRYVIMGDNEKLSLSTKFQTTTPSSKLGVVLCFFGDNELRVKAAQRALEEFKKQTIWEKSDVVFVELVEDENIFNFDFSSQKNVTHIRIKQKKQNQNLFQKECLWNIGAKKLENVDNFIFIDIDTFSQNKSLFAKVNKILRIKPNTVFQLGNCIITQKEDGTITRVQWLWNSFSKLKAKESYCFNPCGGFAISKKVFNEIDGFNPYGLLYGGDILFLYEIDPRTNNIWDWNINNMNLFKGIPRKLNNSHIKIKNEESPLIHCWHGDHRERPYHEWGLVFNELNFSKEEVKLDEDELLSWSNEDSQKKYKNFFENRHLITDVKAHKKLYK